MAGYGSGIGGLLGGAAGFAIGGPMGASLGAGAGGMLGGLFDQPEQVDTSGMYDLALEMRRRGGEFMDPHSDYYTTINSRQRGMLADMYSAGMSKLQNQLASQGIRSNALSGSMAQESGIRAGEMANRQTTNLYSQGARIGAEMLGSAGNLEAQAGQLDIGNVGMNNSFSDQYMSMFGSLLGQGMPSMLQQQYTTPQAGSFANPVGVQQSVTQQWWL